MPHHGLLMFSFLPKCRLICGLKLKRDKSQDDAVAALQLLQTLAHTGSSTTMQSCQAAYASSGSSGELTLSQETSPTTPAGPPPLRAPFVSGAYLYGPVGSGKTMIMDMFYSTLKLGDAKGAAAQSSLFPSVSPEGTYTAVPTAAPDGGTFAPFKRRLHFHEFMLLVHARLHALQQARPKVISKSRLGLPVYR